MKQTVKYIVTYTYNAGLLGADKRFDTEEEARAFAENYKNEFEDCDKFYAIDKFTTTKRFLKKEELVVERIATWLE
jgi:hypothetical protein